MKWPVKKLSEICEINIGRTPSRSNANYWKNGEYAWLSISDMTRAVDIVETKEKISNLAISECNCKLVPINTVLLSFKLSIGKVGINKIPLYTNEAIAALPIKQTKILSNRFLFHALKNTNFTEGVDRAAKGLTLNKEKLKEVKIPFPPLAEQQRIAALLDTADRILRLRESAIAKLDQLAQSVFVEMFGDVIKNNKGWTLKKLSEVTTKIGSGATPRGGDSEYKSDGISLIRSLNVHDGEFRTKNLAYIDDEQADKLSNVVVIENDVLLNITGASVARVCRVPNSVLPARVNQHVMIVRPNKSLNAVYLERLLLSAEMKNKLLSVGSSGATREAITKASAENLLIPVPPIKVQSEFCKKFELLENIKKNMLNCVDGNKQMSSSLQHQSFAVN